MAWYDNELTVKGPHEAIDEFLKFAAGESPFDFSRFLPYPEEFQRLDEIAEAWDREHLGRPDYDPKARPKDGFNSGGCEWRVENWGTDWLPSRVRVDGPETYDDGKTLHVVFHFDTPENPPMAVIKKAAARYPALRFELRYYECQCVSDGLFCCSGGEVVEDDDEVC
jgi:hypothetical protein